MSRIITFRGLLSDGSQQTINLHTLTGKKGYRIVKFELMSNDPSGDNAENTIEVWKVEQDMATLTDKIDFSIMTLLAAGYIENHAGEDTPMTSTVLFDREVFNQDIYVTSVAGDVASTGVNFYLELEQIALDDNETIMATLTSMRNTTTP